ncbi:MAG: substrate-binding domain-containing protein, partial [Halobacillus sp.]
QDDIIKQMFDEQPDIDGVFASDDLIALAVMREAEKRNLAMPEQLKLIGYDGTEIIRTIHPELTTLCQPIHRISKTAVSLLEQQIAGTKPVAHEEIRHEIDFYQGKTI